MCDPQRERSIGFIGLLLTLLKSAAQPRYTVQNPSHSIGKRKALQLFGLARSPR
jgi:hypothetical protein